MKTILALALFGLLAPAPKDDDKKDASKKEADKLQGVWGVTGGQTQNMGFGVAVAPGGGGGEPSIRMTLSGDKLTWTNVPIFGAAGEGRITLDPSKNPPTVDLKQGDKVRKGLYKQEGDKLFLCFGAAGGDRPQNIDKPGNGEVKLTLVRYRPKQ